MKKIATAAMYVMLAASFQATAEVQLVAPAEGETVQLLPARQKEVIALATPEERFDALAKDREEKKEREAKKPGDAEELKVWRVSAPPSSIRSSCST